MSGDKIKEILDALDNLQEDLLSLPDDMLLDIDPRDNESLEEGTRFIKDLNDNISQFTDVSTKIGELLKTRFSINPEEEDIEKESKDRKKRNRIIKELDKTKPHYLTERFTYKRPYGFILGDAAYKGLKTWKSLYIQVLKELKERDSSRFLKLPEVKKFISNRGNPMFAKSKDNLRISEKLCPGVYAEVNLSANSFRNNLQDLLEYFQMDINDMRIYLREDRDAGSGK